MSHELGAFLMNGYLLVLITVISFAVYPSIAPIGLRSGLTPFGFVYQTMLLSTTLLATATAVRRQRIIPQNLVAVLSLSSVFLLEHLALLYSLRQVEVPVAMAVIYTYPLMIAAVQARSGAEAISLHFWVSLGVCFVGIVLVVGFAPQGLRVEGVSLALVQAVLATARIILTGRIVTNTEPIVLATQMLVGASLVATGAAPFMDWSLPSGGMAWASVVGAGVTGFLGHSCLNHAIKKVGVLRSSIILNLEPIVAAVLAAVFLAQILTSVQYLGCLLVVGAVGMLRYWESRAKAS